jgi:hypothetical protein
VKAAADGESHFGEIDIPMTQRSIFPGAPPFELPAHHPAQHLRFTRMRFGHARRGMAHGAGAGAHPAARRRRRVRDERRRGAARSGRRLVLVEDTHGKGHISRHSAAAQTVLWITLPNGFDLPTG